MWRWCSCFSPRGSGSTRYSGGLVARVVGNKGALEGYSNQYWPICSSILAWKTSLPDREAWQATVYRVPKSQTRPKRPCMHRCKTFFSFVCGSPFPVSVEHDGDAAAWLAGTLMVPGVQGHGPPPTQELWPYQSFLETLKSFLKCLGLPLWLSW